MFVSLLFFLMNRAMAAVEMVEKAIQSLPPADLAAFRRWFAEFDAAAWDTQVEADATTGKLDVGRPYPRTGAKPGQCSVSLLLVTHYSCYTVTVWIGGRHG